MTCPTPAAARRPRWTCSCSATAVIRPAPSSFYHTFTGVAVYSEQEKFQKTTFSDIEKGKAYFVKQADNGRDRAWCSTTSATAWIPLQAK